MLGYREPCKKVTTFNLRELIPNNDIVNLMQGAKSGIFKTHFLKRKKNYHRGYENVSGKFPAVWTELDSN